VPDPALAVGRLGDARRRLVHQRPQVGAGQRALEDEVLGVEAQPREARRLRPTRGPTLEVAQGRAVPRAERGAPRRDGPVVLTQFEQLAGPHGQPLEATDVDLVGGQHEPVPVGRGHDRRRAEGAAQPDDAPLDHLGGRRRRRVAPERLGQFGHRHRPARPDRQRGEDDPVARAEVGRPVIDRHRSQQCDRHGSSLREASRPGQWR